MVHGKCASCDESGISDPIATIDLVLLTLHRGALSVALVRRDPAALRRQPRPAGGFRARRRGRLSGRNGAARPRGEARLTAPYLEQLYTFGGRNRDERGWSISVSYLALMPGIEPDPDAGPAVIAVDELPHPPFDHSRIVEQAVARVRGKSTYSSLPAFLMRETFTLDELQAVYESVIGQPLDRGSFRRQVEFQGFVEPVPGALRRPEGGRGRPAQLYRLATKRLKQFGRRMLA